MGKIAIHMASGSLQKEDLIVGIDLGTTNSLISVIDPKTQQAIILKEKGNQALVPSLIHFKTDKELAVGDAAKVLMAEAPEKTIASVKRLMGKSYQDIKTQNTLLTYDILEEEGETLVKIKAGDRFYTPIELSALILKELKARAERILRQTVRGCVITVPAYFNDTQRQATRDAGRLAGLDVLRIINEPTAAALAYGVAKKNEPAQIVAVYDLGGGTFDISILKMTTGIFEVLATRGDTHLGGDDMDKAIMDYWKNNTLRSTWNEADKGFLQQVKNAAEIAKKTLSAQENFSTSISNITCTLTRSIFEDLIAPLIQSTLKAMQQALEDAQLTRAQIDTILMVGGATRTPSIKAAVAAFFGKAVNDSLNPDEVVAMGAAIQADILSGNNKDIFLLDITPLSLGIETMGGLMDVLIPRNSKIPTQAAREYTTQKDGQTAMEITVYQGERDLVRHNRKLAAFYLKNIPAMPAGLAKVRITFSLDADAILQVQAQELRSGITQSISIQPQYGLTDAEVEKMLSASIKHAEEDIQARAIAEARTEAEQLIAASRRFIEKNKTHLTTQEITDTEGAVTALEKTLTKEDKDLIQQGIETLNRTTQPFAERVMTAALQSALRGKKID